ncbi:hypothetical protein [Arcticibacter sp. MXS-1]|uniref:hypothetical protein n=1 Tax=Arcticibacter sp. MXS-1 TaxID=3341726 RepID=UPI0035A87F38
MRIKLTVLLLLLGAIAFGQQRDSRRKAEEAKKRQAEEEYRLHNDWAYLGRYAEPNRNLKAPAAGEKRVIFMGNSIRSLPTTGFIPTKRDML